MLLGAHATLANPLHTTHAGWLVGWWETHGLVGWLGFGRQNRRLGWMNRPTPGPRRRCLVRLRIAPTRRVLSEKPTGFHRHRGLASAQSSGVPHTSGWLAGWLGAETGWLGSRIRFFSRMQDCSPLTRQLFVSDAPNRSHQTTVMAVTTVKRPYVRQAAMNLTRSQTRNAATTKTTATMMVLI
jgi:hypothetical protein